MGVDWGAAKDNENWYLNTFGKSLTSQLSPTEEQYLRSMGVTMPGVDSARQFTSQYDPIKWHGELGRSQIVANEARYDQTLGLNRLMEALAANQLNETGQVIQNTNRQVAGGYADASRQIDKVGGEARRGIMDQQRRGLANAQQTARSRGLGSSTVAMGLQRGVQADTSRALGGLGESLAGMRSGLATNAAESAGRRGDVLSDFMNRRTGIETGLLGQRQGIMASRTDNYNPVDQAAYMQSVGSQAKASKGGSLFGNLAGVAGGALVGGLAGGLPGAIMGGAGGGGSFFDLFGRRNRAPSLQNPNGD
jgi:hypothetical protein